MRHPPNLYNSIVVLLSLLSIGMLSGIASAQPAPVVTGSNGSISTLKQQLRDLEWKETLIRIRLEELDEQLKPESIERAFAGIGSVHPEELREHRRKLLTIERNGLQTQLDLLAEERARIEAALVTAGIAASMEYAPPLPSPLPVTAPAKLITDVIAFRDLAIAELPHQKLYVATILVLLGSGFILLLIVARQTAQRWR